MSTYSELKAQIEALREQAEQARIAEKVEVLRKIKALIVEHQLLPSDFGFRTNAGRGGEVKVAAKYKDPATGATWSGRGRAPGWLTSDRAEYEI